MSILNYRFKLRRRRSGAAGAPADHLSAEMAVNETENAFYYGKGEGVDGQAASSPKLFHADGARLWHSIIGAADGSTQFVGNGSALTGLPTQDETFGTAGNGCVRLSDGTQICWQRDLVLSATATVDWTFAQSFAFSPSVTATSYFAGGPRIIAVTATSLTSASFVGWDETGAREAPGIKATAIGRW